MKAIVYHGRQDLRFEDVSEPTAGEGEVLIRPVFTGICATDIEKWQHGGRRGISGSTAPVIPGHETNGRVEAVGEGVTGYSKGDRVVVNNVWSCGECFWCSRGQHAVCPKQQNSGLTLDGGLAELMKWPASQVIRLPDSVAHDVAALIEPTTVAVRAVRRSGAKVGDRVAVVGCGTVGLLTLQVLKASGAVVTALDVRQQSLEMAKQLGADHAVMSSGADVSEQLLDLTDGIGPDIVIETAGAPNTARLSINWTRRGGTTVLVGGTHEQPPMSFSEIVGPEKTVIGSVAAGTGDMAIAVDLVARELVNPKPLITARVPIERGIEEGFERMLLPEKDVFRILIQSNPR